MTIGQRIEARRVALGIQSQSELARRVPMGQSTLSGLIRKPYRWSPYLPKIARALGTTVEYLVGETDDPDDRAPPAPTAPQLQSLSLPVTLPSEEALAAAFQALLEVSRQMDEAELARELAKRLPTLLRVAGDAFVAPPAAAQPARSEAA